MGRRPVPKACEGSLASVPVVCFPYTPLVFRGDNFLADSYFAPGNAFYSGLATGLPTPAGTLYIRLLLDDEVRVGLGIGQLPPGPSQEHVRCCTDRWHRRRHRHFGCKVLLSNWETLLTDARYITI